MSLVQARSGHGAHLKKKFLGISMLVHSFYQLHFVVVVVCSLPNICFLKIFGSSFYSVSLSRYNLDRLYTGNLYRRRGRVIFLLARFLLLTVRELLAFIPPHNLH